MEKFLDVLLQILSNDIYFGIFKKKFNITVTDVTNLPIEVDNKKRENVQKFYAVVWQLNEEDVELTDDNLEIETIFYLREGETITDITTDGKIKIKDKNGYHYNGLIKLPSNDPFKDGDKMEKESIIITTSYTPTKFIFNLYYCGSWQDGSSGSREGNVEIIDDKNIRVTIDSTFNVETGYKFTGWSYNGQIYNTSPIIFNEPIYLEKVELVAQYESV